MKLIRSFAGAALATAVLAIAPPTEAQETMLNIETNLPASHATSRAMELFKDEVERLSKGSIKVEVAAGSPRGLKELVDAVYVGDSSRSADTCRRRTACSSPRNPSPG